jgi:lysophospholipase L1-like esterase
MADQIIDKRTVAIPGPTSTVPGPRGLPGVNAVPADEAVAAYMSASDSDTRAALDARMPFRWHGHMLVFGDSIARGYDATNMTGYAAITARTLGMTPHNYAVAGSTFMTLNASGGLLTNNIPDQAKTALADTSYDHAAVTLITISGGINDGYNIDNPAYRAAESLLDMIATLASGFPNARIVVLIGLSGGMIHNTPLGDMQGQLRNFMAQLAPATGATLVDASLWLAGNAAYANTSTGEHIHPNDAGHQVIAGRLLNLLLTGASVDGAGVQPYGLRLPAGDNPPTAANPYITTRYDGGLTIVSNLYLYTTRDMVVVDGSLDFAIADPLPAGYTDASYADQGGMKDYLHVAALPAGLCPRITTPVPQQVRMQKWKTGVGGNVLDPRRLTAFTRAQIDPSKGYGGVIEATMVVDNVNLSQYEKNLTLGAGAVFDLGVHMTWPLAVPNTNLPNI